LTLVRGGRASTKTEVNERERESKRARERESKRASTRASEREREREKEREREGQRQREIARERERERQTDHHHQVMSTSAKAADKRLAACFPSSTGTFRRNCRLPVYRGTSLIRNCPLPGP